jgi:hypothetical protein
LRLTIVRVAGATDPIGVLAVEEGAVLPGVGDVIAHAGEPLERVQGFEVPAQGGVHAGAVEDGLLAVEVDELLEGEGVSDEIGDGIFEAMETTTPGRTSSPKSGESRGFRGR